MMTFSTFVALACALTAITGFAQEKTVDLNAAKILEKHVKAVGFDTLTKGKTLRGEGVVTYDKEIMGKDSIQILLKAPDKMRLSLADMTTVLIVNGNNVFWAMGRPGKLGKLENVSDQGEPVVKQFRLFRDAINVAELIKNFKKLSLAKPETVNNRTCHVVVGEDPILGTCKFMICKKTFELVRYVGFFFDKKIALVVDCKQWTTYGSVKLPKRVEASLETLRVSCTIDFKAWQVGTALEDRLFATDKPLVAAPELKK